MYTSVNLDTEANEPSHDLAEATVKELFKSVNSTRSTRETDTPTQTTHSQLSAAGNSDISDLDAVPEPNDGNKSSHDMHLPQTRIYAIRGRSNVFSIFISNKTEQNDIFALNMLSWMKVHLSSQQLAKEHFFLARKVTSFVK